MGCHVPWRKLTRSSVYQNAREDVTYMWFKEDQLVDSDPWACLLMVEEPGIYQCIVNFGGNVTEASNLITIIIISVTFSCLKSRFCLTRNYTLSNIMIMLWNCAVVWHVDPMSSWCVGLSLDIALMFVLRNFNEDILKLNWFWCLHLPLFNTNMIRER